jgi:hypothetical protein
MADLWDAVELAVTPTRLNEIISLIPNAANLNKNIEKLLTQCKLYGVLFVDTNASKIASFLVDAEKAIVRRADFVSDDSDLSSHRTLIRKLARRSIRKPRAKIFTTNDLLPNLPSFIGRVCSSFAPAWGVLRTRLV